MQWEECTITVTYEEAASQPTMSSYTVSMGSAVTIYTNRQSTAATHTLRYSFFTVNQTIATGVADSTTWTPPVSLAAQIPNATSGWGTLLCDTYVGGKLVSTKSCIFTLNVPTTVVPSITGLTYSEATAGIAAQFGGYVRNAQHAPGFHHRHRRAGQFDHGLPHDVGAVRSIRRPRLPQAR